MSVIYAKKLLYKDYRLIVSFSITNNIIEIFVKTQYNYTNSFGQEIAYNLINNKQYDIWYMDDSEYLINNVLTFVYHGEKEESQSIEDVFLLFLKTAFPGYKI
jgi:hypothetical protein